MNKLICLLSCALALCLTIESSAQLFPAKPITLVVPYPPGGSTDLVARRLLEPMRQALNQTVLIENKVGAAGAIGVDSVAMAAPDGYTLLVLTGSAVHVYPNRNVDLRKLTFIASLARSPQVLVVSALGTFKNFRDIQGSAKPVDIATFGEQSLSAYNAMTLKGEVRSGAKLIPYKGPGPALQDLLGGQVMMGFFPLASVIEQVRLGKLHIVGVTGGERLAAIPEVPVISQAGSNSLYLDDWSAIIGPPNMPRDVVAKLAAAINRARGTIGPEGFRGLGMVEDRRDESGYGASVNQSLTHSVGGGGGTTCNDGKCYCTAKRACQTPPCSSGC